GLIFISPPPPPSPSSPLVLI
ncbi:unnamed protein product, partial [Rotaria sp. Silwood1]